MEIVGRNDRLSRLKYEKPIRVQSYDPGGTTGFVEMLFSFDEPVKVLRAGEFHTDKHLEGLLIHDDTTHLVVVYETFHVLTLRANPIPLEVIGVIKWLCRKRTIPYHPQTPDTRKLADRRFKDEVEHVKSHKGSALRHAMTYGYLKLHINVYPEFRF